MALGLAGALAATEADGGAAGAGAASAAEAGGAAGEAGGVLALVHLKALGDLLFSAYGLTLAIKLIVVAVALWLAWTGLRALRSGRPELLTLAGVLALAALLASLPPPR